MTNGQTRRTALGAMAAGVGMASVGLMAMTDQTKAQAPTGGKTFVLVHGAWHGGWCWRRVSDLLEKQGHKVFAPTMTGLGERSHLIGGKIDLATHVTDIVNVIKWENLNDIVLVGHSYGGVVISRRSARSYFSTPSCRRTATAWRPRPRSPCAKRSRDWWRRARPR
jgi:pimeloyl-ACP methyl ester carboxylesterase